MCLLRCAVLVIVIYKVMCVCAIEVVLCLVCYSIASAYIML